jgi:hypothetical protein
LENKYGNISGNMPILEKTNRVHLLLDEMGSAPEKKQYDFEEMLMVYLTAAMFSVGNPVTLEYISRCVEVVMQHPQGKFTLIHKDGRQEMHILEPQPNQNQPNHKKYYFTNQLPM